MKREEVINALAKYYRTDDKDMRSHDWQSGCNMNGRWLCLAEVIEALDRQGLLED